MGAGILLLDWAAIVSLAASTPFPEAIMSCHFLICGSVIRFGFPSLISKITPATSEWSVTAIQSRATQFCGFTERGSHLFAASETQCFLRAKRATEGPGVCRPTRVDVLITPKDAREQDKGVSHLILRCLRLFRSASSGRDQWQGVFGLRPPGGRRSRGFPCSAAR